MLNTKGIDLTGEIIRLSPVLRKLAPRFTRDKEEANDLVQDTVLKALIYKDQFREPLNLMGWLFTIMRNTFIKNCRRAWRYKTGCDATQLYYLNVEDTDTFSSPENSYMFHDIRKNIDTIQREFLIPFDMYTSGYKYREIATHLGIPIGTVKNRIFQARKAIQEKLTE